MVLGNNFRSPSLKENNNASNDARISKELGEAERGRMRDPQSNQAVEMVFIPNHQSALVQPLTGPSPVTGEALVADGHREEVEHCNTGMTGRLSLLASADSRERNITITLNLNSVSGRGSAPCYNNRLDASPPPSSFTPRAPRRHTQPRLSLPCPGRQPGRPGLPHRPCNLLPVASPARSVRRVRPRLRGPRARAFQSSVPANPTRTPRTPPTLGLHA